MDNSPISDEVRRFVLTSIPSVPFLEAILLLRSHGATRWTPAQLAIRLYLGERAADTLLRQLGLGGFAVLHEDGYAYAPADPQLAGRVDRLADLYATHLVDVTLLIHSAVDRKAQQFANAFTWRKDS